MEKKIIKFSNLSFEARDDGYRYKRKRYCHKFSVIVIAALVFVSGCSQKTIDTDVNEEADKVADAADVSETETLEEEVVETQKTDETVETQTVDETAEMQMTENFPIENSEPASQNFSRDWSKIMDLPSEQEIKKFNETSDARSAYITGWLNIDSEMKFSEYSIDFKADYLPYGTYFGCANITMDLSSLEQEYDEVYMDSWLSFYGGLQMRDPENGSGSLMSFWDINCKDEAGEISVIHAKLVYPENESEVVFGHEGNGVNYHRAYTWEKGCWYRMLFQCGRSEENGHTTVEQWICNLETDEWTKLCCYDTGLTDSCFVGNMALFLENYLTEYAGDIRTIEFKNIRIHPIDSEQWLPIKQVDISAVDQPESFCFGSDDEHFWMITTGVEDRSLQQSELSNTYTVASCLSDSPYEE